MPRLTDTDTAIAYGHSLLRGERVHLRELRESDHEPLLRWWNDPATLVLQQRTARPVAAATMTELFRQWSGNANSRENGFAVARNSDDALIGQTSLIDAPGHRCAEFAIVLGPEHTGQGYGTETCRLMLGLAFAELGLHRVELRVWSFNTRAIGAYLRAGFVEEGRRRDVVFHNGHYGDEVIMGILEDEWRRQNEREDPPGD